MFLNNCFLKRLIIFLGCVPSEDELNEFIREVVDHDKDENTVMLSDFVSYLEKQILALRYIVLLWFKTIFFLFKYKCHHQNLTM